MSSSIQDPQTMTARTRNGQRLKTEIALRAPDWVEDIQSNKGAEKMLRGAVAHIAYLLDRFGRSVARMWTLGALSDEARRYSPLVRPFLTLADAELGKPRKPV
jgi:hypothetical protein